MHYFGGQMGQLNYTALQHCSKVERERRVKWTKSFGLNAPLKPWRLRRGNRLCLTIFTEISTLNIKPAFVV